MELVPDARVSAFSENPEDTAKYWMRNFYKMTFCFAVNHAAATLPLGYATALLPRDVAYNGNGMLWGGTLISTLLFAAPISTDMGFRFALMAGFWLYAAYACCFLVALNVSDINLVGVLHIGGSTIAGLGAGLLWTAQGGYYSRTAERVAQITGEDKGAVSARLGGIFAFWFLLCEVLCKVAASLVMLAGPEKSAGSGPWVFSPAPFTTLLPFIVMAILAALSAAATITIHPILSDAPRRPMLFKLVAAASLWTEPTLWLVSLTDFAFGFSAAFMNGYINADITSSTLGDGYIGWLMAATALIAAGMGSQYVYGALGAKLGKAVPLLFGTAAFILVPVFAYLAAPAGASGDTKEKSPWGYGILIFYVLQGIGRGVFESTNKAIFADFFPGAQAEGAFANCMMQTSVAGATCFFLSAQLGRSTGIGAIAFAILIVPCFALATWMKNRRQMAGTEPLVSA